MFGFFGFRSIFEKKCVESSLIKGAEFDQKGNVRNQKEFGQ